MTRRTQADYIKILQSILSLIIPVIPEVAVLDFEMALWQALRLVIPTITLKGCMFHWSQCIWRKIQSLGLQTTYMQRQGPYQFMRKLMALPFLPADHIDPAFRAIQERSNTPNLVELTTYVAEQWMQSPVYPMQSLSVFNHVIRTNNDVEGWHRRMNARASGQGLPFYVLVPYLHQEAQHVRQQVRLVQDNLLTRDNRRRYRRIQSMLEDLWERYSAGTINTSKFLLRAAAVYGTH